MSNILAINAGGGSSRAMLYSLDDNPPLEPPAPLWSAEIEENDASLPDLFRGFPQTTVDAVAHRVVHGGLDPKRPLEQVIDGEVLAMIRAAQPLAPSHDRAALDGIMFAKKRFPGARQVAVFDDALGPDAPALARTVPGPPAWSERFGIRRIGFHGISHRDVFPRVRQLLGRDQAKIISVHLGSGASACAFDGDRIVETTMGMTPMDGAMMGTRAGAVDPGIIFHLLRTGYDAATIEDELNHKSGLFGVSGISLDTRILLRASAEGNERARFALDLYAYRLAQCIASLLPALGGCDALSFTGPIGQHMPDVRAPIVARLAFAGLRLDPDRNAALAEDAAKDGPIHAGESVPVFVIRTLEEWAMARRARGKLPLTDK
jgi:acetate kinase